MAISSLRRARYCELCSGLSSRCLSLFTTRFMSPVMEAEFLQTCVYKSLCFLAYLALSFFVLTSNIPEEVEEIAEPNIIVAIPNPTPPPGPENHGGVTCNGCGKDDPDRMAFVNSVCNHVVCQVCVKLPRKEALLRTMAMCADQVSRVRLQDVRCRSCQTRGGFLTPWTKPPVRTPPKISLLSEAARSESKIVEIEVGSRPCKTFNLPDCMLSARSKLFASRLRNNSNSTRQRLPDHNPRIFGYVQEFIYYGNIMTQPGESRAKPAVKEVFDIWELASYLQMDELADYCAWSVLERYDANPGGKVFHQLSSKYSLKYASDNMKKLIRDLVVWSKEGLTDWPDQNAGSELVYAVGQTLRDRIMEFPSENPLNNVENYYITTGA